MPKHRKQRLNLIEFRVFGEPRNAQQSGGPVKHFTAEVPEGLLVALRGSGSAREFEINSGVNGGQELRRRWRS